MGDQEKETIEVPCPYCPENHSYSLRVKRSAIIANLLSQQSMGPRKVSFTRLFICPSTNQEFQGTFLLWEGFSEHVTIDEDERPSVKKEREATSGQKPGKSSAKKRRKNRGVKNRSRYST